MFMRVALIYLGMTDNFGTDLAEALAEFIGEGTNLFDGPADVYVALFDDLGDEVSADLENGRVAVSTTDGWTVTGSTVENAVEINFGDALADITVQSVGLFDSDTGGSNRALLRGDIVDAPQEFSSGTRVFYEAGLLEVDFLEFSG